MLVSWFDQSLITNSNQIERVIVMQNIELCIFRCPITLLARQTWNSLATKILWQPGAEYPVCRWVFNCFEFFLLIFFYVWRLLCEISYPVWLLAGLDSGRGAPANSSLPPQVTIIFPLHRLSLSIYNWPLAFPTCIGLYVNQSAVLHFPHLPWVSFLSFPILDWWVSPLPN